MSASGFESIQYLSPSGRTETATTFRVVPMGIVVPMAGSVEVMIPWARVLMYTGPAGKWDSYL